jgi:hypothetical protein
MSEKTFRFSEATMDYIVNMDVVIQMREAAVSDIAAFFKRLLQQLPGSLGDVKGERLCRNISHSGKGYEGCDFVHLWIGQDDKKDWDDGKVGYVMFAVPVTTRVMNERGVQAGFGIFDPVKANRIRVWVGYRGDGDSRLMGRMMGLAHRSDLGEYVKDNSDSFVLNILFDPEDSVNSAAAKLVSLLKTIRSELD